MEYPGAADADRALLSLAGIVKQGVRALLHLPQWDVAEGILWF